MRGKFISQRGRMLAWRCFNEARAFCAGNSRMGRRRGDDGRRASMRPAHFAREIAGATATIRALRLASMRPAHFAREIGAGRGGGQRRHRRFNEARAFCAGNWQARAARGPPASRFNEARAFCAGNWRGRPPRRPPATGFNEARAFCAGNWRGHPGPGAGHHGASMRPAHFAREIRMGRRRGDDGQRASMRPAHFAREISPRWKPRHKRLVGNLCESLALLPNLVQAQAVSGG